MPGLHAARLDITFHILQSIRDRLKAYHRLQEYYTGFLTMFFYTTNLKKNIWKIIITDCCELRFSFGNSNRFPIKTSGIIALLSSNF